MPQLAAQPNGFNNQPQAELDVETHANILSCILMDVRDKMFISNAKSYLDKLPDNLKLNQDIKNTVSLIDFILRNNILERKEAISYFLDMNYSDNLKERVNPQVHFSPIWKEKILKGLSANITYNSIKEPVEKIQDLLNTIKLANQRLNQKSNAYDELMRTVSDLNQKLQEQSVTSNDDGLLIIDPVNNTTYDTLQETVDIMKIALTNKIKTIPALDNMFTGGLIPGTLSIFGALPGNFKSGMLHNLSLYASKNNSPDDFLHDDGLLPCILFVSLELARRQLFTRDLAFMGMNLSKSQLESMSTKEIEELVMAKRSEQGFKIPIVYSERLSHKGVMTDISNIEQTVIKLRNKGFQVVMLAIDYIDLMSVQSFAHKHLGNYGVEGAKLLQQKGKEIRDFCIKANIVGLSAAQLNKEASLALLKCQGYLKQVDILQHYNESMFASSVALTRECEVIVLLHKVQIVENNQDLDAMNVREFIAAAVFKDRDKIVGPYIKSERDIKMEYEYETYTNKLKNNFDIKNLILDTGNYHVVMPLNGYRLDEKDYGMSIRIFYPSEKGTVVSLKDIMNLGGSKTVQQDPQTAFTPSDGFLPNNDLDSRFDALDSM